eukprot:TRINITY_DN22947_c0_g1_i1.p1 TRINITY_DN22947_c0_g1~~TRINITY_DN22947_c0_g1_i1.p1  ORF type:complete len:195 (-),score=30.74 TRINITY_DN22947_c0_g1_i1:36-620(-)
MRLVITLLGLALLFCATYGLSIPLKGSSDVNGTVLGFGNFGIAVQNFYLGRIYGTFGLQELDEEYDLMEVINGSNAFDTVTSYRTLYSGPAQAGLVYSTLYASDTTNQFLIRDDSASPSQVGCNRDILGLYTWSGYNCSHDVIRRVSDACEYRFLGSTAYVNVNGYLFDRQGNYYCSSSSTLSNFVSLFKSLFI